MTALYITRDLAGVTSKRLPPLSVDVAKATVSMLNLNLIA